MFEISENRPWFIFVAFPVSMLLLFGPVWAGIWLYHRSIQAGRRYLMVVERIAVEEGPTISDDDARERMARWLK